MKYDILIFDADETLLDFSKAEDYALETSLKNFDISFHIILYNEIILYKFCSIMYIFIHQCTKLENYKYCILYNIYYEKYKDSNR